MQKIFSFFSILFLCSMLVLPGYAHAAVVINDQGAAELKKQVEDSLQWRLAMSKEAGQGLMMDGDITVTPKASFYEVTLPRLSLVFGPGEKMDIGTIIVNATPAQPGEWLVETALPPVMTLHDKSGTPVTIAVGSQHFTGDWWPEKDIYPKFDSLLQNIKITASGVEGLTATVGALKSSAGLKDNGDGTWSGPMDFEASDIKVSLSGKNAADLIIAKVSSHNVYDHLDMRPALEIRKALQQAAKDGLPKTDKEKQALLAGILLKSPISVGNVTIAFEMDGFSLREAAPATPPARDFGFDKFVFGGSSTSLQQDKSKITMNAGITGLHASFVPADFAGLMPGTFNIEISIDNLPAKKMLEPVYATLRQTVTTQSAGTEKNTGAETIMRDAIAGLPKLLQDAGASVSVQNTFVRSADLDTTLSGKMDANAAATFGATGKMTLSVKGMDEAAQKFQSLAAKDPQMMGITSGLTGVQMMGQADKAADGKSLRNYALEITPDGSIMLNGADIKGLAMMLGKPSAPAQTPIPAADPVVKEPEVPAPAP
jgi:hypothetical protein